MFEEAVRKFLLEFMEMDEDGVSYQKMPLLILLREALRDTFGDNIVREGDSLIVTTDFGYKFKTSLEMLE